MPVERLCPDLYIAHTYALANQKSICLRQFVLTSIYLATVHARSDSITAIIAPRRRLAQGLLLRIYIPFNLTTTWLVAMAVLVLGQGENQREPGLILSLMDPQFKMQPANLLSNQKALGSEAECMGSSRQFQHFEKPKTVDSDLDANSSLATLSHGAYQSTSWIFRHHDKQSPNIASIAVPATFDARIIGIIEVTRWWIHEFYWLEKRKAAEEALPCLC